MGDRQRLTRWFALAGLFLWPAAALAQKEQKAPELKNYDEVYARYLNAARQIPLTLPATTWMTDLATDPRARRANDLVTIRVIESLSALGAADSAVNKQSNANVSFPGDIGEQLAKFFPNSSETKFNGSGGTSRTTELTAVMTARVTDVLPTGDLVVEGVREIDVNGDRLLVVLSGVIRAVDIQPGNVIASTRIGQLRIRSLSQGLIKDSLSPGWLIRALNKIF